MVVWFNKNASFLDNKVDYKKLIKNMEYIRKYTQKNEYCQYLYDLALEYQHFLKNEQHCSTIVENLVKNLSLCSTNTPVDIPNNSIILSPSHENTYHLVADFNKTKNKNIVVFCFDMHCDCYDSRDMLWKGNVFSKLLDQQYINNLILLGVPAKKAQNTLLDIDQHVLDKVRLINTIDDICFADLECSNLFVSIDIDVLNCRQEKLTALEYCPNTILSMFSKLNLNSTSNVESEVKSCIFVKNQLGYSDLYKSGENNINVDYLIKTIKMLKQRCDKFDVEFGITSQQRRIVGEITELNGFDYGNNVYNLMNRLINIFESLF